MRQAGVLAAAGLIALEETPQQLRRGPRATRVSWPKAWRAFRAFTIDPEEVATNIVIFDVSGTGLTSAEISARLKRRGVLINGDQ